MAIRDIFKLSRKTFFNPTGWIDFDSLKERNRTIFTILRDLFAIPKPEQQETFEQAVKRLNLTEAELKATIENYRTYAFIFLILGLLVFSYSFYLLFTHGSITGLILAWAATAVFLSQAFRYDFWSFQMRQRRLGATFAEWKANLLGGRSSSHD